MQKASKTLAAFGIFSVWLAASAFSQTLITFDTAQDYTNNFNEVLDRTNNAPADSMHWSRGQIVFGSDVVTTTSTAAALFNPSAATSTNFPTYATSTVSMDTSTNRFGTGASTIGIIARAQPNGSAVFASYIPSVFGLTISITYGGGYGIGGTTLYSTNQLLALPRRTSPCRNLMSTGSPPFTSNSTTAEPVSTPAS